MLTIILIVLAFSILVLFHEFGHFLMAKLLGVKVEKFALGFGPEWFGFSTKVTRYSVNLFPLGGFVKMLGENPTEERKNVPEEYLSQKWYRRMLIVFSGPVMNFVLAVILFSIIFMVGIWVPDVDTAKIGYVYPDTPAFKAGLKENDVIIKIDNNEVSIWEDMTKLVKPNYNKTLTFTILRDKKELIFKIKPEYDQERKTGLIGVRSSQKLERYNPVIAVVKGSQETFDWTVITIKAIVWMFTGKIKAEVSGPVGIAQMIGMGAKAGFASLVAFIAVLSINLGIFNLFPIPILDGGHLLFLSLEGVRGKPVGVEKIKIAQSIGLAILISIFLFATYKDILRLFMGN